MQRVVIQGGDPGVKKNVDFKGTREVATWLFDDEEAEKLEKTLAEKEKEAEESKAKGGTKRNKKKKTGPSTAAEGTKGIDLEDLWVCSISLNYTQLTDPQQVSRGRRTI